MTHDQVRSGINIEWDVEFQPTVLYPDCRRVQRIWVEQEGKRLGGVIVSTTGFTETVLGLDDDRWRAAVRQAVENTVGRTDPLLAFASGPGPDDHFRYTDENSWVHHRLPAPGSTGAGA